jgi:hypothetical protein
MQMKPVEKINVTDISNYPVWEYATNGETIVRPVCDSTVNSLQNRIVGTIVKLANGKRLWAILSGISLKDRRSTEHFLTLSIEKDGAWFHLARYFDVDYDKRNPRRLAEFLGLHVSDVFPIEYDLSEVVDADVVLLKGSVPFEPKEKLSEDELMELAVATAGM